MGDRTVDDAVVIESRQRITGECSGRRTETVRYSPDAAPVRSLTPQV